MKQAHLPTLHRTSFRFDGKRRDFADEVRVLTAFEAGMFVL